MKRKISLLLAAVMTMSLLSVNVFAASNNRLTKSPTVVPEKTLLYEENLYGGLVAPGTFNDATDKIKYQVDGTDLVITLKDGIKYGDTIKVELENARWFFRSSVTTPTAGTITGVSIPGTTPLSTESWGTAIGGSSPEITYDATNGVWLPDSASSKSGFYYRYGNVSGKELNYEMQIPASSDKVGIITALEADIARAEADASEIRIPLVTLTTDAADVTVKITDSNLTTISTGTYKYASASSTLTNTYIDDPKTARDEFPLNMVVIKETRLNSIKPWGTFEIVAPSGFTFGIDTNAKQIIFEPGLNAPAGLYANYDYKTVNSKEDHSIIVVTYGDENGIQLTKSTRVAGAIVIKGLSLYADEDAAFGDILLKVRNKANDPITAQTNVKAGTRVDWTISLKTTGEIPELVNGRYIENTDPVEIAKGNASDDIDDEIHQTAHVVFSENSVNAWWAGRQTIFTLPKEVKFRKVEITDVSKMDVTKGAYGPDEVTYYNNGEKVTSSTGKGSVIVDGNTMTWNNYKIEANEKASVEFDAWVSIQSGFDKDVTLTVTGSAIPGQGDTNAEVPAIVIAKQITPVTLATNVTDLRIGYQYQRTADIEIKEAKAGILMKDKEVRVSVSDLMGSDMIITPDTKVEITEGDLKISSVSNTINGSATTSLTGNSRDGSLSFTIEKASSKASTIKLTNVSVKVDRTVPVTNYDAYKVYVWGTAIAENFGLNKDQFKVPGVSAPYVKIITSAVDEASVLRQEVRVTIGESFYTVNNQTFDMDAAAYISPASNSTMVPVRFVANAFGLRDDQVIWDDVNKTVSLIHPSRVIQFKANSNTMVVNGSAITMFSPDKLAVKAEIKGEVGHERMYIPFRALGEAFGVTVDWDTATNTAIYNKGANTDKTAAESNVAAQ